jgi:hypothetical protein
MGFQLSVLSLPEKLSNFIVNSPKCLSLILLSGNLQRARQFIPERRAMVIEKLANNFRLKSVAVLMIVILSSTLGTSWSQESKESQYTDLDSSQVSCGTKIDWTVSLANAKSQARMSNKPLFILHLSGDFQNEDFT